MWVVLNRLLFFHCSKLTIYWIYTGYTIKLLLISRKDSDVPRWDYETWNYLEVPSNAIIDKNPVHIFLHAFSSGKKPLLSPRFRLWSLTQTSLKCLLCLNPWVSLGFCSVGSTAELTSGLCAARAVCGWPLQLSRCHYRKDMQKKCIDFWNE